MSTPIPLRKTRKSTDVGIADTQLPPPSAIPRLTRTPTVIDGPIAMYEPINPGSIRVISREKYSRDGNNEVLPMVPIKESNLTPNFPHDTGSEVPISQADNSIDEVAANHGPSNSYWGVVEPFPLGLREIMPPPISPPSYSYSPRPLPPLPEEDSVLETPSADLSNSSIHSGGSENSVLDDDSWSYSLELGSSVSSSKQTVDRGVEASATCMTSANLPNTSWSSAEDWDQFVLVEPMEDKTRHQEALTPPTPISFQSHVPVIDGPDERLQKRLKNWPRYLQNLLEA